ncbi:MAG: hypothetical protein WC262_08025 [Bacteroidales bacterium]|jgi:hypothetical protein
MKTIQITSDTLGKLRKIRDGDIFDDPTIFVTELIQNAYRARAKNIWFSFADNSLHIHDDGSGCKRPENVLTLDFSQWDTTDEGFGIGFWSILSIPHLEHFAVYSHKWSTTIDVKHLFATGDLDADIEYVETATPGFDVTLISPYIRDMWSEIVHKIKMIGSVQPFNIYINDEPVLKRSLLDDVCGTYTHDFSTNLFTARLSVEKYENPALYYEKRPVTDIYATDHCGGIVEMRSKALNLKEPDRKSIIRNDKYYQFVNRLNQCTHDLYIEFIKQASDEEIDDYADIINNVLSVNEYENYIRCAEEFIEVTTETRTVSSQDTDRVTLFNRFLQFIENLNTDVCNLLATEWDGQMQQDIASLMNHISTDGEWTCVGYTEDYATDFVHPDDLRVLDTVVVGNLKYVKVRPDREEFVQDDDDTSSYVVTIPQVKHHSRQSTVKSIARKPGKKVWITSNDLEDLSDLKARAEYYGIKVLIAKNVLHENIYRNYHVPYITELRDGVVKRNIKKNVELKTKKEDAFIGLLQPICVYFNLPRNTFMIGNLKLIVETRLNGKVIDREQRSVAAVTDDDYIIFDRRALGLKRFNLRQNGIGRPELKALMANLDTIAHELAHRLYGTEDNTLNHYKTQSRIQDEIVNLYLTL